jgi:hypothetical protein
MEEITDVNLRKRRYHTYPYKFPPFGQAEDEADNIISSEYLHRA